MLCFNLTLKTMWYFPLVFCMVIHVYIIMYMKQRKIPNCIKGNIETQHIYVYGLKKGCTKINTIDVWWLSFGLLFYFWTIISFCCCRFSCWIHHRSIDLKRLTMSTMNSSYPEQIKQREILEIMMSTFKLTKSVWHTHWCMKIKPWILSSKR